MAAKYFVWGEGVWRELDVASGRVSGWRRRARFVFVRRGRLLVARRRPVLRALEQLAVGQPSAAADGPRLLYRSKSESHTKRKHETPAVPAVAPAPPAPPAPPAAPPACHHHCCAHRCNDNDERPAGTRNIATQCAPSGAGSSALTFKVRQKHDTAAAPDYSSADEFVSTSARRPPPAARRTSEVKELFGKTPATEPPATAADKKRAPGTSLPADKSGGERRERARKRPRTVVSDNTDSTSVDEPLQRSATTARETHAACKELIITDEDVELLRGYVSRTNASALQRFDSDDSYKRLLFYAINPLVQLERCARLECLLHTHSLGLAPTRPYDRPAPRTERSERPAARTERSERPAARTEPSERPAQRIERSERPAPRTEPSERPAPRTERSASADTDKENKDRHSSPNKVREPVGATKKSPEERPAASEPAPPSRATSTRLGVSERSNKLEKEGAVIKAPETIGVARDPPRAKPERSKQKADIARAAAASPAAGSAAVRAPLGSHVISKRAAQSTAKEYSNLEDHAIVAWLSGGSRASLVSGNRVWRDLQDQYERLTGRARTWHSLRNRYLRYILPSLGALQLPPADVSRLRAAAATGAIKTKNRLATRRYSALQPPASGAASRRPAGRASRSPSASRAPSASSGDTGAATDEDANGPSSPKRRSLRSRPPESASKDTSNKDESGNESASKASGSKELNSKASTSKESSSRAVKASRAARSPRYSEVTRRFAARRRAASSSSRSPSPRPASSRSPASASRSRRLFNPNTNV